MGNVSSRPDDGPAIFLRDQNRFSVAGLTITDARNRTILTVSPDAYPAFRYTAKRDVGDDSPVDFVQDPDSPTSATFPNFLLRLSNDDDLIFNFACSLRQQHFPSGPTIEIQDTQLSGLTYVFGSNAKEIDQLLTREFHADPNLHKNPNVQLVGDYNTAGSPSLQFQWAWRWRAPSQIEDRNGGCRTCCSFVEYDQRAHRLNTLASFSFWVQTPLRYPNSPVSPSSRLAMTLSAPRLRVPSAQSIESRISAISDSDGPEYGSVPRPQSPAIDSNLGYGQGLGLIPSVASSNGAAKVDVNCVSRPGEDLSTTEDGPLFRATMKALELKTGSMRSRMKKVLRTAEAAEAAQLASHDAFANFTDALRDASASNANAVQPAIDHYFEKIAKEILLYERQNAANLRRLIIEPMSKLYTVDIKQADSKKRDFEEESKDYYAYVGRYLGQRTESLKEKKRVESDSKYQAKRRTFELKRFDYSSYMHDLLGGRKDQEVLSQLTRYADAQAKGYLQTSKKIEEMIPQLEALCQQVSHADKDFMIQRTEREEKRRALEKTDKISADNSNPGPAANASRLDGEQGRNMTSRNSMMLGTSPPSALGMQAIGTTIGQSPSHSSYANETLGLPVRSVSRKFKGYRDLEEKVLFASPAPNAGQFRKEGLLWSLSRPGSHVDPKALTKTAWHKFWIVLDQGKLSEYVNWKDKLDLHMEPIDLRVASVREARSSDRRFCFEVITPQYTRVYQAPSEEDMKSWIAAINNALQDAFETRPSTSTIVPEASTGSSMRKDIGAVLTGKSSSFSGHRSISSVSTQIAAQKAVNRNATTGDRPGYRRANSNEAGASALLNQIRDVDEGNKYCADCGSDGKVEWVSINLGILLCIECSGIHRSLGTHISKVRSLTLDTSVFTPDMVELFLLIGNRVSNMIWEAKLDQFLKPSPHSTREQRLHFITAKYHERAYVQPIGTTPSHYATPDETLLASIKKNDIHNVLYALALHANPNAHDRSRATHAVFLALAAADPATPTGAASSFSHSRHTSTSTITAVQLDASGSTGAATFTSPSRAPSPQRKAFPVAELLLQNGADIPTQPAPFPLSRAAQLYLDVKTDQRTGRHLGGKDAGGDHLSALPSIVAAGGGGAGGSPRDRDRGERERERDRREMGPGVKRNSAGFVGGVKVLGPDAGGSSGKR